MPQEGFIACLIAFVLSLPQLAYNMGMFTTIDYEKVYGDYAARGLVTGTKETDTWTAEGRWGGPRDCPLGEGAPILWGYPGGNSELLGAEGAGGLSWVHPITDCLSLTVFLLYMCRIQRLMLRDDSVWRRVAADISKAQRIRRQVARKAAKSRAAQYTAQAATKTTSAVFGRRKSTKKTLHAAGDGTSGAAVRVQAVWRGRSGRSNAALVAKDAAELDAQAEAEGTGAPAESTGPASADERPSRSSRISRALHLPPVSEWWKSAAAEPSRIDVMAKACSIVLYGWTAGRPIPAGALNALTAIEPPLAVEQAKEVFELFEAMRQLELLRNERDRQLAKGEVPLALRNRFAVLQARVTKLHDMHTGSSAGGHRPSKWSRVSSKMTSSHGRLLPIAFVTFRSSKSAEEALSPDGPTVRKLAEMGVSIGPAPRPTDVKWIHLHKETKSGILSVYDLFVVVIMVPSIAFAILVATGFAQMCLFWTPFNAAFTGWLPVEKWIGGGHWLWGIIMFTLTYELLHQFTALPLGDGGVWPENFAPVLKDWYHSRTLGQFRFVKVVAAIEMLAMLFACGIILPGVFDREKGFAESMCNFTCICWWINPHFKIGTWYDMGAGSGVNAIVNAFIGDAFLNGYCLRHFGLWLKRTKLAKKEPSQHLMDEAVRSRDIHYLPWRIVHLVKVWTFMIVLWPVVPLVAIPALAYWLISFFVDRHNMLRLIEPLPPSSGLCMRFVLTVLMPLCIPIHLAVGVVGYVSVLRNGGDSLGEALGNAKVLFYIIVGSLLVATMLVEIFWHQRRIALHRKLMTPWQVFCAAFQSDRGFAVSSKAEPFPAIEASLDLTKEQASKLYRPPFVVTAAWTRNLTSTVELADSVDVDTLSVQVLKGQSTDELPKGTSETAGKANPQSAVTFSPPMGYLDELSA